MPYGQQGFIPNGVQPTGYPATPAISSGFHNPMGTLAAMSMASQLSNGFSGGSSSSFSSSSSDVSIVKYDDHFRKENKNWCLNTLKDLDGNPAMTADEIKDNPPIGLKFKGCDLIIPIPNAKAMCATSQNLLREIMGGSQYMKATDEEKKNAAKNLSRALFLQYIEACGYGTGAIDDDFCARPGLIPLLNDEREDQNDAYFEKRRSDRKQNPGLPKYNIEQANSIRGILKAYTK